MKDPTFLVRELAKSDYFQSIYSLSKERSDFCLFENKRDFTNLQIMFLKYLNFYSTIYTDIALGDVTDIVLDNHIYEDSYIMYKNKSDSGKLKENKTKDKNIPVSGSRWIFKSPPKARKK